MTRKAQQLNEEIEHINEAKAFSLMQDNSVSVSDVRNRPGFLGVTSKQSLPAVREFLKNSKDMVASFVLKYTNRVNSTGPGEETDKVALWMVSNDVPEASVPTLADQLKQNLTEKGVNFV